jgi:hypothetical protein
VSITFSDAGSGSGVSSWSTSTCSGNDVFTASAGTCP